MLLMAISLGVGRVKVNIKNENENIIFLPIKMLYILLHKAC